MTELMPGTSGGQKQLFNKEHRGEILSYFDKNGLEATLGQYNMKKGTLDRLMRGTRGTIQPGKRDRVLMLAEIANERSLQSHREVLELKTQFGQFTDVVAEQLLEKFFKPLLGSKITLPPELELKPEKNLLSLEDIEKSGEKNDSL